MSLKISNTQFVVNGRKHEFAVQFFTYDPAHKDKVQYFGLANENIELFEYVNALNALQLMGKVVYNDVLGTFGSMFSHPSLFCTVHFQTLTQETDGITIEGREDKNKFEHTFMVENVKILSKDDRAIKYEIRLVSSNWLNLSSLVDYSNYGKGKKAEPVTDIIKNILSEHKLTANGDTFDEMKSDVSIRYISGGSEDVFSAVRYLMKRTFYDTAKKEKSLRFIIYDEQKDEYRLFSLSNPNHFTGHFTVFLSSRNSGFENLANANDVEMRSVVKRTSKDVYHSFFKRTLFGYDIMSNKILPLDINANEIKTYANEKVPTDTRVGRYKGVDPENGLVSEMRGSVWGNDFNVYEDMVRNFMECDALIVNIDGNVRHKPGAVFGISLREADDNMETSDIESMKDLAARYKQLRGAWISTSVRHQILPLDQASGGFFRSNVCLSRNSMNDD